MEAKETVIKLCNHPYHNKQCHADQAEISFKAGIQEVLSRLERVEHYGEWEEDIYIVPDNWQAKLKEWGL